MMDHQILSSCNRGQVGALKETKKEMSLDVITALRWKCVGGNNLLRIKNT